MSSIRVSLSALYQTIVHRVIQTHGVSNMPSLTYKPHRSLTFHYRTLNICRQCCCCKFSLSIINFTWYWRKYFSLLNSTNWYWNSPSSKSYWICWRSNSVIFNLCILCYNTDISTLGDVNATLSIPCNWFAYFIWFSYKFGNKQNFASYWLTGFWKWTRDKLKISVNLNEWQ